MQRILARLNGKQASPWDNENPISAEIFGPERFAQHAHTLAAAQKTSENAPPVYPVTRRLEDNSAALHHVFAQLCAAAGAGKTVTPAAEWLIDNFHLVEEQIRHTRLDLPPGFYRQLPKLVEGPLAGHPRIFGLVWAYVAHTDSNFDPASLAHFVRAYEEAAPLTIGELWATAIALRLTLIENLRRISERMNRARLQREAADDLADKLLGTATLSASPAEAALAAVKTPITVSFAVQLTQRLRDLDDAGAAQGLDWLKGQVKRIGHTMESIVTDEHHRQAAANVSVRNIVGSMRLISDVNWESWFDEVSLVERLLREHPVYAAMDFRSRNMYRTAIEELSRGSGRAELEVARLAIESAPHAPNSSGEPGHCLIGAGRREFERFLGFHPQPRLRLQRLIRGAGLAGYLGAAFLITFGLVAFVVGQFMTEEQRWWLVTLLAVLALFPASEIAFAAVNQLVSMLLNARILPGLAFRDGIPEEARTMVVVPALLTGTGEIDGLVERLEVHFLSNGGGELCFALLTDFADSDEEHQSTDESHLAHALARIEDLNRRHETDRFLLFHRKRMWNASQGKWMGWERKRGKLQELNRLLRGTADTTYTKISGKVPENIRYVITLDQDTRLPREAARHLIGKLAHPLNRAVYDERERRVRRGYSILQPRVTASLPTGGYGSYYQQLFSSARGIDPYVWAVSDVYQDLFSEGSFAGKGIYDVDAFEKALEGRVPENAMLSHDLFEGVFARSALLSDVEVVEDYPERYEAAAARSHRWSRGDWQLLPWIARGGIPGVGLWKMVDNLRRTLVPPAQVLLLLCAWVFLSPRQASLVSLGVMLSVLLPSFIPATVEALRVVPGRTFMAHVRQSLPAFRQSLSVAAANLMFLPDQARLMLDAIGRTLHRLFISRRLLLEWTTAAQVQASALGTLPASYAKMWAGPAMGLATLALAFRDVGHWYWLLPLAGLWLGAPAMAHWMSQPADLENELLGSAEAGRDLRLIARRTWRFFETFANANENALPPDNFQEDPQGVVAHRTSPTNIGLYMLSTAAARELGWITTLDAAARLEATMATMRRLETFRGHLLNWYDTETLRPLEPLYVSSVDSGNLAGHLLALANYCEAWAAAPQGAERAADGVSDALDLLLASLPGHSAQAHLKRQSIEAVRQAEALRKALVRARDEPDMIAVRLVEIAMLAGNLQSTCAAIAGPKDDGPAYWAGSVRDGIEAHFREATMNVEQRQGLSKRLMALAQDAREFAMAMDFRFLLDPRRDLLSIGYRVVEAMRDENCYDMLASEARLASFFAVAKGDLPTRHWFKLGRSVTQIKGGAALISWSGSMFEYLMPSLVMRAPSGSLLDQTTRLVVARQQEYGEKLGVPWGISESAFAARDTAFTYQYSNFGVPGLGLKRGLAEDLVIAPYATGLASMVAPRRAAQNYAALAKRGASGVYGYYEAIDYTPTRLRPGERQSVVRAYFAHHQGMSIVAILNALKGGQARAMFHEEPMVRAAELLLQERVPQAIPQAPSIQQAAASPQAGQLTHTPPRAVTISRGAAPVTNLLSNGELTTMLTAAGSGYLQWNGIAITRWREDPTVDGWGQFIYLRDVERKTWWSAGHAPSCVAADSQQILFSEQKVEFMRKDANWRTAMDCLISSETNAEARRITITNEGFSSRDIEITTYAELALAQAQADAAHPAFSKLFIATEYLQEFGALIATRRKRSPGDPDVWAGQMLVVDAPHAMPTEYETDRARFLGRCRDARDPAAMAQGATLSNFAGTALDPIFALRCRLRVPRARQLRLTLWTMVAQSRDALIDLIDQHRQPQAFERAQMLAWTQAQIQLRHLGVEMEDAHNFQELASHVIYANLNLRAQQQSLQRDSGPQSALWAHGVSGDRPIVLLRIDSADDIPVARELIKAFGHWRSKRLAVDLVILNDRMSSYVQDLQQGLEAAAASMRTMTTPNREGEVYLLRADLMAPETIRALAAAARVVLFARHGRLSTQLLRLRAANVPPRALALRRTLAPPLAPQFASSQGLAFWNGHGGFDHAQNEFAMFPSAEWPTPAPWSNIIANPRFGLACSSDGLGYCWAGNARETQITGWSNDPVANAQSEAVYIMDRRTGTLVSPTLLPLRDPNAVNEVRHGFGYSFFKSASADLTCEITQFVAPDDPVKLLKLRITNAGAQPRALTVTHYAEWVLGPLRSGTAQHVMTELDEATGAMFARNHWSQSFAGQLAFMDMGGRQSAWTGDRFEFMGKLGGLEAPAALTPKTRLSNFTGAGVDPCGALQADVSVPAGGAIEITMTLGAARDVNEARSLIAKYRRESIDVTLAEVKRRWSTMLGAVQVKTPEPAMDLMLNGWLLYQALACRMWGRAGFYQASGAYGYRDQLQDSMALLYARPDLAREHILRAAGRQFIEGDVQHWWLPEAGNGIRTKFSDDVIWLVYCVARYVTVTGDRDLLDERVQYLEGQRLEAHEHELFFQPETSKQSATVFEHCAQGLAYSLKYGEHDLPLMGTGDWNDGMSRVGAEGKGESVWLAWFMIRAIKDFTAAAADRHDARFEQWNEAAAAMAAAVEKHAWDGKWYRRAFHDSGVWLGSSKNSECAIDAIAQSWSVISGAARNSRAKSAMNEVQGRLIDHNSRLAMLFTPPFDGKTIDPGYIAAYPPGIRENGGQYTHGSLWSIFAFAELGDGQRAEELFRLINPVNHALSASDAAHYHVEPYVVAADVYSVPPHRGRGGWTWYTGAAAWLYRAGLEAILGLRKEGNRITIKPCVPAGWQEFEITLTEGDVICIVKVRRGKAPKRGAKTEAAQRLSFEMPRTPGTHRFELIMLQTEFQLPMLREEEKRKTTAA